MLFDPKSKEPNDNDPYMINPKGFKILVPERMVQDLLKQGFVLVDKKWQPTQVKRAMDQERNYPLQRNELLEEIHKVNEVDLLEITEI